MGQENSGGNRPANCEKRTRRLGKRRRGDSSGAKSPEQGEAQKGITTLLRPILSQFTEALDQDLNTAAAWGHIFEWVRTSNKALAENSLSPAQAAAKLAAWEQMDAVLGVAGKPPIVEVPPEIEALLNERQAARKAKDFARADAIRNDLKSKGWVIEDTPKGPKLKKL